MARGKRTSLAALAGDVGDNSPVEEPDAGPARSAPLAQLTANPRNPREGLGDLADLASIADMQLQPAVVVTAGAYRALYPDDDISTRYVVINGCRRLAAAHKYGLSNLDIVVNDAIARDRLTLRCNRRSARRGGPRSRVRPRRPRRRAATPHRRLGVAAARPAQTRAGTANRVAPRRTGDPRSPVAGTGAA